MAIDNGGEPPYNSACHGLCAPSSVCSVHEGEPQQQVVGPKTDTPDVDREWEQFNRDMDVEETTITRRELESHYYHCLYALRKLGANPAAEEALKNFRLLLYYKKGWW